MSTSTFERTYGVKPDPTGLSVDLGDRVIPASRIVGVSEAAQILTETGRFAETYPDGVPRARVSSWANRWKTTGFPRALPIDVERGLLFDADEVRQWQGPPGRWQYVDLDAREAELEQRATEHGMA